MPKEPLQLMVGGRVPVEIAGVHQVTLESLLGSGGFGSMWKAIDTTTGKAYALKVIPGIIPGSVMADRVRLEAGVAIPSEYIVKVLGLREWDPSTFLILFDYFQGTALDTLLQEKTLSVDLKKRIFKQILRGVSDAHRHNVIHRDLKPGNILVADDGTTRLIDFGISKFKGVPITKSGDIIGTISYMAPEIIIRGAKVADARCDIYSLGHILYELSMGQHFWTRKGWTQLEDLISYLKQVPSPTEGVDLSDFRCDFFTNTRDIVARMTKIDPEQRYSQVNEILMDLGLYTPGIPDLPPDFHLRHPLLIIESGTNERARTVLGLKSGEKRTIGREDLAGNDSSISRTHLEFTRCDDQYFVRDLNSKNGTLVRGTALKPGSSPIEIRHTDRIKVGEIFLRFVFMK
jgi:serine/threonine protein kinase